VAFSQDGDAQAPHPRGRDGRTRGARGAASAASRPHLAAGVPGPKGGQGVSHRPRLLPPRHLHLVASWAASQDSPGRERSP
jgi:hypothetical protein